MPKGANSLAVVVVDRNAKDPRTKEKPGATPYVHFVLIGLSPSRTKLSSGDAPSSAHLGKNSAGRTGWTAPCPPKGTGTHHYEFTVYALKDSVKIAAGMSPSDELKAIVGAGQEQATEVGTVSR